MMSRTLKLLLIFSLTLNLGVIGAVGFHAAKPPYKKFSSPENRMKYANNYWSKQLNLTPEQSEKIKKSSRDRMNISKDYYIKINEHRRKLIELFKQEELNRESIANEIEEINKIRDEHSKKIIDHLIEHKNILTPEQRAKYFSFLANRMFQEEQYLGIGGSHHKGKFVKKNTDDNK